VASNDFLMTLPETERTSLMALARPAIIPSGTDLFLPGDSVDWVYFPLGGLVSLICVMLNGDQAETGVVGREGAVGLLEAAGSGILRYRAVVQIDLDTIKVPASHYLQLLGRSVPLQTAVASHLELTIAEARQTIACHAHHPARGRLAWWLLECQDRTGLETLRLTQEFLAAMLGVQRTTVVDVATLLKDSGLIQYRRGAITILDRPGLERASCECYATIAGYRHRIAASAQSRTTRQ